MSLVSVVGRKSLKVRLMFLAMYLLLMVGAVTMVYPFLLMVCMATSGKSDSVEFNPIPAYWTNDSILFKKYIFDAAPIESLSVWFDKDNWFTVRDIQASDFGQLQKVPASHRKAAASDARDFIANVCPAEFKQPLFLDTTVSDSPFALQAVYFKWLKTKYHTVSAANKAYTDTAQTWEDFGIPTQSDHRKPDGSNRSKDWRKFIETRSPECTALFDADTVLYKFLSTANIPTTLKSIPRDANGHPILSKITYDDLITGKLGPDIKHDFLTQSAWAKYIRLDMAKATPAWKAYLAQNNKPISTRLTDTEPITETDAALWNRFIQTNCPLGAISLMRPEDSWRQYLKHKYANIEDVNQAYGTSYSSFETVRIPYAVLHYDYFLSHKDSIRRQYMVYNFATVINYIALHGHALWVTVIYILLTIGTTLTVNPLAAYAMSRFRLKETYHILVFLLATMAFPAEVLMIPSFLMVKSFPLGGLLVVAACTLGFILFQKKFGSKMPLMLSATLALVVTGVLAGWVLPHVASALHFNISASLMNSYWALVLPGLANGYGIFLLKGFFDSLPPEVYEAGLIDGAGEMRMFWSITLPLCKPILAVIALGAFGAAYGAFMHAFLVCQDPKMWTLMVFIYEFQQKHTMPMVMASLVIAAIPTMVVFMFAQNVILRGIIIPTYK
ncbi:carbohydrate ABC transporter permease [bacterium]|nr:carbohydrate ABC transporter permease [bacterium]